MEEDEEKHSMDEFLEDVHGEESKAGEMGLELDLTISKEDVEAYMARHPFLQILNLDPTFEDFDSVNLVESASGWTIQDFGDALSASQGNLYFDGFGRITIMAKEAANDGGESEEGGEGSETGWWDDSESDLKPGKGTVIKQGVDTVTDMIELIKERWKGVHIVAGSELMKWAAWKVARGHGLEVYGYEPTNEARSKRAIVERAELRKAGGKQMR